jgi:hypothetical protein
MLPSSTRRTLMQTQSLVLSTGWRRPLWIALLVAASVAFTLGFACATPLAAFAAIAALSMPRKDALLLIGLVWLANQAVGSDRMAPRIEMISKARRMARGIDRGLDFIPSAVVYFRKFFSNHTGCPSRPLAGMWSPGGPLYRFMERTIDLWNARG